MAKQYFGEFSSEKALQFQQAAKTCGIDCELLQPGEPWYDGKAFPVVGPESIGVRLNSDIRPSILFPRIHGEQAKIEATQ